MAESTQAGAGLDDLRRRITHWRRTRQKLGPMPALLWDEATRLARRLGVYPVCRALGLNYDALRQRTRRLGKQASVAVDSAEVPEFVELSGAQLAGSSGAANADRGPVIEAVFGAGAHLTVRLPPGSALDVAGLLCAFKKAQR
jgi:hypothetical protein